jgi:hypothetical protein
MRARYGIGKAAAMTSATVACGFFIACGLLAGVAVGGCTNKTIIEVADAAPNAPAPEPDAGEPLPDGGDGGDANAPSDGLCHAAPAKGYADQPYAPPASAYAGVCTDRQIAAYIECASGTQASCAEVTSDCKYCIEPKDPAAGNYWGPYAPLSSIEYGPNVAGCGAVINGDTTTTGCGSKLTDYLQCVHLACDHCEADHDACLDDAYRGDCEKPLADAKYACPKDVRDCYPRSTDHPGDRIARIIKRFCGTL